MGVYDLNWELYLLYGSKSKMGVNLKWESYLLDGSNVLVAGCICHMVAPGLQGESSCMHIYTIAICSLLLMVACTI